jgi:dsDNA-specific endonuclease/ATPase MutS2
MGRSAARSFVLHAILARLPGVESFALAGAAYGGPGATFAKLKPL